LDMKSSKLHRYALRSFLLIFLFFSFFSLFNHRFIGLVILSLVMVVIVLIVGRFKHRGFTHSIFGLILYGFCLLILVRTVSLSLWVPLFGMIGYVSHITLDLLPSSSL
jgi:membrane-bound metal-dependent hydrolase YbcI (DUF457 family)